MNLNDLTPLPDDARLWCFAADRSLSPDEAAVLTESMASFLAGWTAHARELLVGFELRERQLLLVAVDERQAAASGCSIDALTGHLREMESDIGVALIDGSAVWYRDPAGDIQTVSRPEFRRLGDEGSVGGETSVFALTLIALGQLRQGRLEVPARASWHGRLLTSSGARSAP